MVMLFLTNNMLIVWQPTEYSKFLKILYKCNGDNNGNDCSSLKSPILSKGDDNTGET